MRRLCRSILPTSCRRHACDDLAILPVYVWHDARTACRDPPHAPGHRGGHDRSALWHGHSPGRSVLLSVIASLGPRAVAWDAGAAGAWRRDRRLCRPLRCGTSAACVAGFWHHQPIGCGDALPHDAHCRAPRPRYRYAIRKMSFTGEPIDSDSQAFAEHTFGTRLCSMYGTTEVGVILANYPGAGGFRRKTRRTRHAGAWRQGGGAATGRQRLRA